MERKAIQIFRMAFTTKEFIMVSVSVKFYKLKTTNA